MTDDSHAENPNYADVLPEEEGVMRIAERRIVDETHGIQSAWRGVGLETGSNILFTGLAFYSATHSETIIDAWKAAGLVYVPQGYDLALGYYRKHQLSRCVQRYSHTGQSREFDRVGLALRGAAPDYAEKPASSLLAGAAKDMIHLLPGPFRLYRDIKNPFSWGTIPLPVTSVYYALLNLKEVKNIASGIFKKSFQKASGGNQDDISFSRNEHRNNKRVVAIPASKSHTGKPIDAPANPHRLATNLSAIKWDMLLERGRIVASGVGIYGVYHFLHELYPETLDHIYKASQNPTIESVTLAATWATVMAMGAGAAQHFLEERPNIQAKLDSNQAKAAINNEAMIMVWDAIATLKDKIRAYQDPKTEQNDADLLEDIVNAERNIDRTALDSETRAYVDSLLASMHQNRVPANDDVSAPSLDANHP